MAEHQDVVGKSTSPKARKAPGAAKKRAPKQPAIDKREVFIRQYLIHKNQSRAYREAGYAVGSGLHQSAHQLFISTYVQARLAEEREKLLSGLDVDVEQVFARFKAIAFGDAAAITEYVISACRYCHGVDHHYQWRTEREFNDATAEAIREADRTGKNAVWPNHKGGFGFTSNLLPHPDCPECDGDGRPRVRFKDTRLMTDEERALFAGVKQTQHGIEFKFNDQVAALKELAEHLQFYRKRDESNANALARAIAELQDRGQMGRMPLNQGKPEGEKADES